VRLETTLKEGIGGQCERSVGTGRPANLQARIERNGDTYEETVENLPYEEGLGARFFTLTLGVQRLGDTH
jgi:hypothetical protein